MVAFRKKMDTILIDIVNFLLKFMYLAIYQYIAKN